MTIDCSKVYIKLNSKGNDVKELQKYLKYLGYYTSDIDGQCGKLTVKAIKKLQKQYKVSVDGEFGPKTCKACTINGTDVSKSTLTLDISTWKNMMKRYNAYCEANKKEPNICYIDINNPYQYVTATKYKEILQRYEKWTMENKKDPLFVYINYPSSSSSSTSTTTTKTTSNATYFVSSPHWVGRGCGKLGQCTSYYCGPHSIKQCNCKLGIDNYSEGTIAGYAGTTTAGTGHAGLDSAIKYIAKKENITLKVTWLSFTSLGDNINARFKALGELISQKNIAVFCHLLYRNRYGHYELIKSINTKNNTLEILNSLGTKYGSGYYGYIETRSFNTQASYLAGISQKGLCVIEKI